MKDVAERAQVSVGTVSNVLNEAPSVAPEVRQRVLAAIAELGYVRNDAARRLRTGRSLAIGVMIPDIRNPFYTDIVRGAGEAAWRRRLSLILGNGDDDPDRERAYLDLFDQQGVRGVLVAPYREIGDRVDRMLEHGIGVVLIDQRSLDPRVSSVGVDDAAGARLAVRHLTGTGRGDLVFAGGSDQVTQVADRLAGASQAAAEAGADLAVLPSEGMTASDGARIARRILAGSPSRRPSGIFAVNDLVALGIMQELLSHGIRVPGDVAIIGFDDIDFAASATVPLTTVRQPRELLGATAVDLLLDPAAGHGHISFAPELVTRASTGAA